MVDPARQSIPTPLKIALDCPSIPCTSCECERTFSGGGRTITTDRNSLHGATIEALQLQKNWLKNGVVDSELKNLVKWFKKLPQPAETETDGLETEET